MSDDKGSALMLDALPEAEPLLGERGYDANGFRKPLVGKVLVERGLAP